MGEALDESRAAWGVLEGAWETVRSGWRDPAADYFEGQVWQVLEREHDRYHQALDALLVDLAATRRAVADPEGVLGEPD